MSSPPDAVAGDGSDPFLRGLAEVVEMVTAIPAAQVRPERRFVDDLHVDSLAMVEVLEGCRLRLGTPVPDAVTSQLVHVGDLVDFLRTHARTAR